ncbi:MAG TPA: hypothetical protein VIP11_25120 [Gemmatimonadaceae bacterium]
MNDRPDDTPPDDLTHEVPEPIAVVIFFRADRPPGAPCPDAALVLEVIEMLCSRPARVCSPDGALVREMIEMLFASDPSLERVAALIDGGGKWESRAPWVASVLELVYGPHYSTRGAFHPYGRGPLVAMEAAEDLGARYEMLAQYEEPGGRDGIEVVF